MSRPQSRVAPDAPLILAGAVDAHDLTDDGAPTVTIGGQCVIAAIGAHFHDGTHRRTAVTVAIADESFTGALRLSAGECGYSEYTPAEPARLFAGPHNLMDVLARHHGKDVTLFVSGVPINVMEPVVTVQLAHPWRGHRVGSTLTLRRSDAYALDRSGYVQRKARP